MYVALYVVFVVFGQMWWSWRTLKWIVPGDDAEEVKVGTTWWARLQRIQFLLLCSALLTPLSLALLRPLHCDYSGSMAYLSAVVPPAKSALATVLCGSVATEVVMGAVGFVLMLLLGVVAVVVPLG